MLDCLYKTSSLAQKYEKIIVVGRGVYLRYAVRGLAEDLHKIVVIFSSDPVLEFYAQSSLVEYHTVTRDYSRLILDEFSSGFHNDLEKLLIRYFMKYSTNAQMLFVTHSTNLLSSSILRPDQLYTVEFGEEGSRIKRFSDEKPREAQNMEKMYLGGVFGGLPRYEN